ncbi:tyrosine-type recombinase/integrase [Micromonospora sp. WMMD1102]|uniref:tyrosine-type recombinase/integrase n=1 Tax=Micromonospora sp. WMMD1102 TaxID=3016105 RepID=UPI002414D7B6|nr:tyrosine-type recombinase/integrase [Micromonospora sp. WMMD1102]MDG4791085.1 tyrosine-type recombinase/integrase [Micromonospora sp. WMMD1102]
MSTYDVRIHAILTNGLSDKKKSYTVRWKAANRPFRKTFATRALAESFRSKLVVAQREGTAFDEKNGLPEPMARELNSRNWYDLAVAFVDMKWSRAAATQRKSIADALTTVTLALLTTSRGAPTEAEMRHALYTWIFNKAQRDRDNGEPPSELASTVRWLKANTLPLPEVADPATVRKTLDLLTCRIDGSPAAANTVARKRAVFYGALKYAVELRYLESHPMDFVQWRAPKNTDQVDRKVVVNPDQARALLRAVRNRDPHLEGFFACMYFAALRPSEVIHLRADECELPEEGWGWLRLSGSTQQVGEDWSDSGKSLEDRELKHRAKKATRDVPICPELVSILRRHLRQHCRDATGRMFNAAGARLAPISKSTYLRAWRQARAAALTPVQQRSPLAHRPYDLRHAAVSLWLNAGVPATQVAQWAGHSVHVLLKVYASCIDGQDEAARKRIEGALGTEEPTGETSGGADT